MSASITNPAPPPPKILKMFKLPGRDRNKSCPCGSGKKWKKCHPYLPDGYRPPILTRGDPPEKLQEHIDSYLKQKGLVKSFQNAD